MTKSISKGLVKKGGSWRNLLLSQTSTRTKQERIKHFLLISGKARFWQPSLRNKLAGTLEIRFGVVGGPVRAFYLSLPPRGTKHKRQPHMPYLHKELGERMMTYSSRNPLALNRHATFRRHTRQRDRHGRIAPQCLLKASRHILQPAQFFQSQVFFLLQRPYFVDHPHESCPDSSASNMSVRSAASPSSPCRPA